MRPGVSQAELKRAYRGLARQFHPDTNPDPAAPRRFQEVHRAYELLKATAAAIDPAVPAVEAAAQSPRQAKVGFEHGRLPRSVPRRGNDVRGEMVVSLEEAFAGASKDVSLQDHEGCERCGATGAEPGSLLVACPACKDGRSDCVWCAGEGQLPDEPCAACSGAGVVEVQRSVRVAIPRSIGDGDERTFPGKGKWGLETRGDLMLTFRVQMPSNWRRDGSNLEIDIPVGVFEAVLGGYMQVPTPDRMLHTIELTPGSSSGKRYRLQANGMYDGETGDQRGYLDAIVQIAVPTQLTERERTLWRLLLEEEHKRAAREG